MSKLAQELASIPVRPSPTRRGPLGVCSIYPPGDIDDWNAVEEKRVAGLSWREVQAEVDALLNIERPILLEKFRYHWRRRCSCWPVELRLS